MSNVRKILILPSWYPSVDDAGAGVFIFKHAKKIAENFEVTVLSFHFTKKAHIKTFIREKNIVSPRLTEERIFIRDYGSVLRNVFLFFIVNYNLVKLTGNRNTRPDVLNLNVVYHIGIFAFPVLYFLKIPLVITEHWTGYFKEDNKYFTLNPVYRYIVNLLFRKASKVICISQSLAAQLEKIFNVGRKSVVIPNVLQVPDQVKSTGDKQDNPVSIITISNLVDRAKNISGILNAVAGIAALNKYNFHLFILGDGPDWKKLENHAKNLEITNRVTFKGFVNNSELQGYYQSAAFFILNSNFETFSIATAEALLNGTPVIVTRCVGPEEYVDNAEGILINRNNTDELSAAMVSMLENWKNYSAREISVSAAKKFQQQLIADKFKLVFERVGVIK